MNIYEHQKKEKGNQDYLELILNWLDKKKEGKNNWQYQNKMSLVSKICLSWTTKEKATLKRIYLFIIGESLASYCNTYILAFLNQDMMREKLGNYQVHYEYMYVQRKKIVRFDTICFHIFSLSSFLILQIYNVLWQLWIICIRVRTLYVTRTRSHCVQSEIAYHLYNNLKYFQTILYTTSWFIAG